MLLLRDYEILYIVRPDLDEEQVQGAVSTVNKLIENLGGVSQKTDVWGRKRLAYEVRHLREGQYVLQDFQIEPERVPEMEATLKISDTVFRHLIVRKPDLKDDPRKVRREARAAAAAAKAAEAAAAEAAAAEAAAAEAEAEPAAEPAVVEEASSR